MKTNVTALFDLDGTLTRVRSLESSFIAFLLKKRRIRFPQVVHTAGFFLRTCWNAPSDSLKRNKMYLRGIPATEIETLAGDFISSRGKELLHPEGVRLLLEHMDKGHVTILVTGSLELLVEPLVRELGLPFERTFSTKLRTSCGLLTGEIDGIHYHGESKRRLATDLASQLGFSLEVSYCYADSRSDIPLLSLFGNPVAVNPDRYLARTATRKNWKTVTFT